MVNRRQQGRGARRGGGRGGSRGRGGRRVGRFSRNVAQNSEPKEVIDETLDIEADVSKFFLGVASFDMHLKAQTSNRSRYAAAMAVLHRDGVEISQNARVRALAVSWALHDHELANSLLKNRSAFGVAEVLKALSAMDAGRKSREWEKKLAKVESQGKVKKKFASKVRYNMDNLNAVRTSKGTVSGALCKHIKRWVREFSTKDLEYYALHFPTDPWKKLSDLCHFNPKSDFPNLPWFLPYCFGQSAPEDSLKALANQLIPENVNEMVKTTALPYTDLRKFAQHLTEETKAWIVRNDDKVDRGIWWYEDLRCAAVDDEIYSRLERNEPVTLTYGKLMERLMLFSNMNPVPKFFDLLTPIAEIKLETTCLNLESPVVVIGDASSSMSVAIRTATIISSLLTAITKSDIIFFNNNYWYPPENPRTIADVLKVADNTKASGCTAHAAALWPYYESKKVVKTFIVVTDEEENTAYQNYRFFPLFQKYREEIFPAKLVFISFLRGQHASGQMMREATRLKLDVQQFVLQASRPDLNKLDTILGKLGAQSVGFEEEVRLMTDRINTEGLSQVLNQVFAAGIDGEYEGATD